VCHAGRVVAVQHRHATTGLTDLHARLRLTPPAPVLSSLALQVPAIFGTNENEGRIFVPAMPAMVPGTSFPPKSGDLEKAMHHFFEYYSTNQSAIAAATQMVADQYPNSHYANSWVRACVRDRVGLVGVVSTENEWRRLQVWRGAICATAVCSSGVGVVRVCPLLAAPTDRV